MLKSYKTVFRQRRFPLIHLFLTLNLLIAESTVAAGPTSYLKHHYDIDNTSPGVITTSALRKNSKQVEYGWLLLSDFWLL